MFLGILILPLAASAQFGAAKTELAKVAGKTGLSSNFESSIGTIIKGALSLVGTIFLILTVYAGYLWMTASGNEEQVTKAKDIVTQAIIGLAITLGAYAITTFVTGRLTSGGAPSGNSACEQQYSDGVCGTPDSCVSPRTTTPELCPGGNNNICCHN